MRKTLCVFCGQWYDWDTEAHPAPAGTGGFLFVGCCGANIDCLMEGVILGPGLTTRVGEKYMIAREALAYIPA